MGLPGLKSLLAMLELPVHQMPCRWLALSRCTAANWSQHAGMRSAAFNAMDLLMLHGHVGHAELSQLYMQQQQQRTGWAS